MPRWLRCTSKATSGKPCVSRSEIPSPQLPLSRLFCSFCRYSYILPFVKALAVRCLTDEFGSRESPVSARWNSHLLLLSESVGDLENEEVVLTNLLQPRPKRAGSGGRVKDRQPGAEIAIEPGWRIQMPITEELIVVLPVSLRQRWIAVILDNG